MYKLIVKQFVRSRAVVITIILVLVMGVVSILIGRQFLFKEEKAIAQVAQHQQQHIARNVQYNQGNFGLLLYYLRFALINKPDRLAALSIGQRDVNPGIQNVTIRSLEAQKYDTDLHNPANLLSGNLDLGFVIIYLFPLAIIAFTFNILSEESESGAWRLVAVQSGSTTRFLVQKLSVRIMLIYATLVVLFILARVVLSLPVNQPFLAFILLSILYLAFWFAFSFWIISFQKGSSFNALVLLSVWVLLAVLLPAAVNNSIANRYPVPESLSTVIRQRDGYHQKWDVDKKVTMDKFYAHYPQFKKYAVAENEFSYTWYYAMQQMGDDESRDDSNAMRAKILQREEASRMWSVFVPTMHAQLLFNDLAGTNLRHHLHFLDQTDAFHEKLRLYFYPRIFENAPVKNENWSRFIPEYAQQQREVSWMRAVLPLLFITVIFSILTLFNLKKPFITWI